MLSVLDIYAKVGDVKPTWELPDIDWQMVAGIGILASFMVLYAAMKVTDNVG